MTDDSNAKYSGDAEAFRRGPGTGQATLIRRHQYDRCRYAKLISTASDCFGHWWWKFLEVPRSARIGDRVLSDTMGMMATIMNAMAMQEALTKIHVRAKAFSALPMPSVLTTYTPRDAREAFAAHDVVLCAGGTGNPYFTTDSAAALRALELQCEVMLKATKVDYVCDKDPKKNPDANIYKTITYAQVLEMGLEVMDLAAVAIAREGKLPIIVFNMQTPGNLEKVAAGEDIGTTISA